MCLGSRCKLFEAFSLINVVMVGAYVVTGSVGPIILVVSGYVVDVDVFASTNVTIPSMCGFAIRAENGSLTIHMPALFQGLPGVRSGDCPYVVVKSQVLATFNSDLLRK